MRVRREYLAANRGTRVSTPAFVLLVHPSESGGPIAAGLGITVTKRVGNAVVRNRIKRRFRALARDILPRHGFAGADHVLIGRGAALDRPFDQLSADLERALAKARRLRSGGSGA